MKNFIEKKKTIACMHTFTSDDFNRVENDEPVDSTEF